MNKKLWEFYLTGQEAQEAMLRACEDAERSIDLEQYIFNDDAVGRAFAEVLIRKAKDGVRVRLLCDTVGSHGLFVSDLSEQLRSAGVTVQFFNPIEPWWLHKVVQWFLRDHRKILIIDGVTGYTGGVGLEERMRNWRDTHVMVTGPVVEQMQLAFERMWLMTSKGKRIFKFLQPPELNGSMVLVTNTPYRRQRFIYHALLDAIKRAEKEILLTSPYFVPDRKLFRALRRAARRGVSVQLMVPVVSDQAFVKLAGESYYWLALRAGIRIFQYQEVMMHAKTAVIDEAWAMVGSSNLDNLSLLLNYEDTIVASDKRFVAQVKKHFEHDTENSVELTQEQWHARPLGDKFLEFLTWPLHRLL